MRHTLLASLTIVAAACGPTGPTDDFSEFAGANQEIKSDSFSKKMNLIGSLSYGDQGEAAYHNPPRYVAFSFQANGGDSVAVTVDAANGNGDAWIVDGRFRTLAHATAQTPSVTELDATLAASDTGLHYIIVREHDLMDTTFTVHLDGKSQKSYDSCKSDADCVAISKGGCCPNGWNVAVNKNDAKAYAKDHGCTSPVICAQYFINDTRQPECDVASKRCVMIPIDMIHCGGFTMNPHSCPTGYQCKYNNVPDVPGSCVQTPTCVNNKACIQGTHWDGTACACVKDVCVQNVACVKGSHWDSTACKCVQDVCVQNVACVKGSHWDSTACKCVQDVCVQTVFCVKGSHWDTTTCKCVQDDACGGCAKGQFCSFCWGHYACIPNGAVC